MTEFSLNSHPHIFYGLHVDLVVVQVDKVLLVYDYVMCVHATVHRLYVYVTHPSKTIRVPGNIHSRMSSLSVTSRQSGTSRSNTAQIFVIFCQIPNAPLVRRYSGIYTINGCLLPPIMSHMFFKCIINTFDIIWFCFISHILRQIITDANIGHYQTLSPLP